ncbi:MAG: glycosyltransferase [Pseudanabaena sp. M135S2SP2A07QC]|jgi:dolichol-phosphate mannosyltransferase|nr:glycosyltransferase [Pseudanabaena sp. M090S1SP2A07QC]MCA6505666.1 glycosyltransferase [Pseudanabaena sp. M172S2SP2A07QC]MCA6520469.1 glycosyltransferase [Pseudanabaena sp. M051S1SP2A07QC]MCA6526432.1 glycosyltransferase [Pseudanabaena sp. M179S2SP2A07QC]MCA6530195.1 glycosyltransferase [Pseudanabaena sp. M125S2SP2A07QC]MCA6534836.1 glycosyltransferase [Pseudanabaena sp. M176S2SP2A07QC]MCA6539757.1 glycosyltransferase [Pseudanabaena sp. M037S2SP2A07QC]MCA6543727.1 glycosyltransferase [Pse
MSYSLISVPLGTFQVNELLFAESVDESNFDQVSQLLEKSVKFSLIVPTYNESKNLAKLVEILTQLLNNYFQENYELIIVDDDSPDLTWQVGLDLMPNYPQLRVMRRQGEKGLSTAVIRGWQASQGEILGVIDGDLQHPPETLIKMLDEMVNGADLVVASRHVEGGGVSDWGFMRRVLSRGAQMLGLLILPNVIGRVSDPMSGYFMVRRSAIANYPMNPLGYKILIEVLGRGNIGSVAEVGYVFQERQEGESKVTWRQYVDYILHLLRLRSRGRITKLREKLRVPVKRFLKFGLVGFSGVFVDMAIFYLLSDASTMGWGLTRSKIIAAEVAVLNNFLWNDLWTFRDLAQQQFGRRKLIKRFVKFNLICLVGIGLNLIILNFLYNNLHINKYLANLIAIAIVTIWNFWFNLKLSWRVTQTK